MFERIIFKQQNEQVIIRDFRSVQIFEIMQFKLLWIDGNNPNVTYIMTHCRINMVFIAQTYKLCILFNW